MCRTASEQYIVSLHVLYVHQQYQSLELVMPCKIELVVCNSACLLQAPSAHAQTKSSALEGGVTELLPFASAKSLSLSGKQARLFACFPSKTCVAWVQGASMRLYYAKLPATFIAERAACFGHLKGYAFCPASVWRNKQCHSLYRRGWLE